MNFGDLVKSQQQPSTPTPALTATITSTTQDPTAALPVSGDVKFALGLLDGSGGNSLCRNDDLGRQDQVSKVTFKPKSVDIISYALVNPRGRSWSLQYSYKICLS